MLVDLPKKVLVSLLAPLMFGGLHDHSPLKTMAKANHGLFFVSVKFLKHAQLFNNSSSLHAINRPIHLSLIPAAPTPY